MDVTANSSPSAPYILHRQPLLSILPTSLAILLSTLSALLASFRTLLSFPFRLFDYRQQSARVTLRATATNESATHSLYSVLYLQHPPPCPPLCTIPPPCRLIHTHPNVACLLASRVVVKSGAARRSQQGSHIRLKSSLRDTSLLALPGFCLAGDRSEGDKYQRYCECLLYNSPINATIHTSCLPSGRCTQPRISSYASLEMLC